MLHDCKTAEAVQHSWSTNTTTVNIFSNDLTIIYCITKQISWYYSVVFINNRLNILSK